METLLICMVIYVFIAVLWSLVSSLRLGITIHWGTLIVVTLCLGLMGASFGCGGKSKKRKFNKSIWSTSYAK